MSFDTSPAEIRKIKRVQFGVLSPDEVRTMSVCEVTSTQTFDNGLPREVITIDISKNNVTLIQIQYLQKNKHFKGWMHGPCYVF